MEEPDGTNIFYYAIETAVERLIWEADEETRRKIARFLRRELTVEQVKGLYKVLS